MVPVRTKDYGITSMMPGQLRKAGFRMAGSGITWITMITRPDGLKLRMKPAIQLGIILTNPAKCSLTAGHRTGTTLGRTEAGRKIPPMAYEGEGFEWDKPTDGRTGADQRPSDCRHAG